MWIQRKREVTWIIRTGYPSIEGSQSTVVGVVHLTQKAVRSSAWIPSIIWLGGWPNFFLNLSSIRCLRGATVQHAVCPRLGDRAEKEGNKKYQDKRRLGYHGTLTIATVNYLSGCGFCLRIDQILKALHVCTWWAAERLELTEWVDLLMPCVWKFWQS